MELIDRIKNACQGISNPAHDPGLLRDHLRELVDDIVNYLGLRLNPALGKLAAASEIPVWEVSAFGNPHISQNGMTYRQWLVGMALQGLLSAPDSMPKDGDWYSEEAIAYLPRRAVEYADATITELEKTP